MKNTYRINLRIIFIILVCIIVTTIMLPSSLGLEASVDTSIDIPADFQPISEEIMQIECDSILENSTVITAPPELTEVGSQRMLIPGLRSFYAAIPQIPSAADNSKLKYFPYIMDQGSIGSCYACSEAYVYTHMTALFHDVDVKKNGNSSIFSPQYIYNVIDSCVMGSYVSILRHGILTLDEYPYTGKKVNPWPTTASQWRAAIKNRAKEIIYIDDFNSEKDFILLKQYLANGYVFSSSTNIDRWEFMKIKNNPNSTFDDSEVNLWACAYTDYALKDASFNHRIIIVGYNDDIWIDINNNGIIDSGELGALKIANSWGTQWANNGFCWVSYDSIGIGSAVSGITSGGKSIAATGNFTIIPREENYTPKLLAEVTINSSIAAALYMEIGWGKQNSTEPEYSIKFNNWLIDENDEYYSFDGSKNYTDATFVFDLTYIIEENDLDIENLSYDWYLKVTDRNIYNNFNNTTVKSYKLTDADGNVLVEYNNVAKSCKIYELQWYPYPVETLTNGNCKLPIVLHGKAAELKIPYGRTSVPDGSYVITWDANGGSGEPDTLITSKNETISEPPEPEREGYKFVGWYADGKRVTFPILNISNHMELTAKWTKDIAGSNPYLVPDINNSGYYIDLDNEILIQLDDNYFGYSAYSLDGGKTWKNGSRIFLPTLLNKSIQLVLTDGYDSKQKKLFDDATIVEFPLIEARPKTNPDKLIIDYSICADPTNITTGAWTLVKKGSTTAYTDGIEIAPSRNGKTPDEVEDGIPWYGIDESGIPILPYGSAKQVYLARTAPVVSDGKYIPASKPFKLTPLTQQKQTNYKADYKNEIIKLKAGTFIFGGTVKELEQTLLLEQNTATSAQTLDLGLYYKSNATDKSGVVLTKILDNTDLDSKTTQSICIWTPATAKKPATMTQEYKLAIRNNINDQTFIGENGKVSISSKLNLEFLNTTNNKWGSLPKYTASTQIIDGVRIKSTAKANGKDDSLQLAKSKPATLTIKYGVYTLPTAKVAKSGILEVIVGSEELSKDTLNAA